MSVEYKRASPGHFRQYGCVSIHVHACDPVCITYRSAGGGGGGGVRLTMCMDTYKKKLFFVIGFLFVLFLLLTSLFTCFRSHICDCVVSCCVVSCCVVSCCVVLSVVLCCVVLCCVVINNVLFNLKCVWNLFQ